jgi:hypothetical protein
MNHRSRLWLLSTVLVIAACSAGGSRPEALEDDVSSPVVADRGPGGHPKICVASGFRECKLTWVDANGQVNCPTSWQFCNNEGTDWYDCGDFDTDEDGHPLPPKNPRKGKATPPKGGNGNGNGNGKP